MPGIIGYVADIDLETGRKFLENMARSLESEARFKTDLYNKGNLGLGRISLPFLSMLQQPVWNEASSVCLVMEGEIYDYQGMKADLIERGHRFKTDQDAEFVLHLYEEFQEAFVTRLNGAFAAAVWDGREKKLVLVNDRLGLYPLYYAHYNNRFTFSSGVRALLADPSLPRSVDREAIAQFLTFDHLLDDHTLLEAVRLMPQASIMIHQGNRLEIRPYWDVQYINPYPLRSEDEYIEALLVHLKRAVEREANHDDMASGILLSGGLDSRVLLALLKDLPNAKKIHSFTWGIPGCDDARIAQEVSRAGDTHHHFYALKPDWLLSKGEEAVRLTDGMGNIVNMHALATLEEESEHAQVIYKGFLGDAMMGFGIRHQLLAEYDEVTTPKAHLQVHTDQGVITFNQKEHEALFTEPFRKVIGSSVFDAYTIEMLKANSSSMVDQRNRFDFTERVPRMTIKGVEVVRSRAMVRLPFCDNDLVDFSLTIPPGLRYERRLMKNAFVRTFPKMAQIPFADTGLPMMVCFRDVRERAKKILQWRLRSMGINWTWAQERRPYKDYNQWFRTVLRPWVENTLLNKHALERGYYNPDYLRQIVTDHMSGANYAVRLGAFLSIELWHKQFLD